MAVVIKSDPLYTLTKHAVVGFVRSVAPQLEERGIRINAVAPGIAATPLIGDASVAGEPSLLLVVERFLKADVLAMVGR